MRGEKNGQNPSIPSACKMKVAAHHFSGAFNLGSQVPVAGGSKKIAQGAEREKKQIAGMLACDIGRENAGFVTYMQSGNFKISSKSSPHAIKCSEVNLPWKDEGLSQLCWD